MTIVLMYFTRSALTRTKKGTFCSEVTRVPDSRLPLPEAKARA